MIRIVSNFPVEDWEKETTAEVVFYHCGDFGQYQMRGEVPSGAYVRNWLSTAQKVFMELEEGAEILHYAYGEDRFTFLKGDKCNVCGEELDFTWSHTPFPDGVCRVCQLDS